MSTPLRYRAFLLCPDTFQDPRLPLLHSSRPNRQLMHDFLADPRIGVCNRSDIVAMSNEPARQVKDALEGWFRSATFSDVLVFYYSGHGLAAHHGELRLATHSADVRGSLAITGGELSSWMSDCHARLIYVIVDACHAGVEELRTNGRVFQILASGNSVVADSLIGQPSPFTSRLVAYLRHDPNPSFSGLFQMLRHHARTPDGDELYEPFVKPPANMDLGDVPLRRPLAAGALVGSSGRSGGGGWVAFLVIIGIIGAVSKCGSDDDRSGTRSSTSVVATAPQNRSPSTLPTVTTLAVPDGRTPGDRPGAPETTQVASEPPASFDLGIVDHPLATPACTGGWIAQIASVDSANSAARATVIDQLALEGTSYTYAPQSCSTFNRSRNWYVIFLGPFTTEDDARAACASSGDEDCFARQLL